MLLLPQKKYNYKEIYHGKDLSAQQAAGGWLVGRGHGAIAPVYGLGKTPSFPFYA
jgi:hypothetical protein